MIVVIIVVVHQHSTKVAFHILNFDRRGARNQQPMRRVVCSVISCPTIDEQHHLLSFEILVL